MYCRPAEKKDSVEAAYLIHLAIKDIADALTGEKETDKIRAELAHLFQQENNRLSYQNCLVIEEHEKVIGIAIAYAGDDAEKLDKPIIERLIKKTGNNHIQLDKEAEPGDYYIDTVSVHPLGQGKGIGSLLFKEVEKLAKSKGFHQLSLNVAEDNPRAKKLYTRLGYKKDKVIEITGHEYDYMIKTV